MEASGVVARQPIGYSNTRRSGFAKDSRALFGIVGIKQKRKSSSDVLSCAFRDQGHLQYYHSSNYGRIVSEKQEKGVKKIVKTKKKQVKVIKGLRRDLLALSEIDFGLGADGTVLLDEAKSNMISEATNLLLEQLQKLKAEEKETKKKMKEEKAKLKDESSSSSSESSSESDCGEVVDMKTLKNPQTIQILPEQNLQESIPQSPPLTPDTNPEDTTSIVPIGDSDLKESVSIASPSKKIEVCMGGKCKKSGGAAILDEFQRVLGIEASVSGCKCMGKCKVGPNVKVSSNALDEDSVRSPANNSLCIGVGLEDVGKIVASILGDDHNQIGLAGAA